MYYAIIIYYKTKHVLILREISDDLSYIMVVSKFGHTSLVLLFCTPLFYMKMVIIVSRQRMTSLRKARSACFQ